MKLSFSTVLVTSLLSLPALASDKGWFARPYAGISQLSNTSGNAVQIDNLSGDISVNLDPGFNAGLGIGYQFSSRFAAEITWEYRSNDSQTLISNQSRYEQGNYASNLFFINGIYSFPNNTGWTPYLGVGLAMSQEIDIDLERTGIEQSYAGSGDLGLQIFAGTNFKLSNQWMVQFELRYGNISDIKLVAESGQGNINNIDYITTTAQLGLVYRF